MAEAGPYSLPALLVKDGMQRMFLTGMSKIYRLKQPFEEGKIPGA